LIAVVSGIGSEMVHLQVHTVKRREAARYGLCFLVLVSISPHIRDETSSSSFAHAFVPRQPQHSNGDRIQLALPLHTSKYTLHRRTIDLSTRLHLITDPKSNKDGQDDISIVDAIIETNNGGDATADLDSLNLKTSQSRIFVKFREALSKLAKLSLQDYKWRSSLFKSNEADRRVEESLARMMGEDPSYVRPMDASDSTIGPLGRAEKDAVVWLSKVIEEEGKRAELIAESNGELVRPIDLVGEFDTDDDMGPLAFAEKKAVEFLALIRKSEMERSESGVLRPKDMDESMRGPLGEAEARVVMALNALREAERLRVDQSKLRGGEVVRPIDVPGPLGEIEKKILEVFTAEKQRAIDREENEGKLVRPKDSTMKGPFGRAEKQALDVIVRLREEEQDRLRNIERVLAEKRPMESNRKSPLGLAESFSVGLLRAPTMFAKTLDRVKELLSSEELDDDDEKLIKEQAKLNPSSSKDDGAI